MRSPQLKNKMMINDVNIIEKGSALPGQKQTPAQQKQRNRRHRTTPAVIGLTDAPLTGYFNYFRVLICNELLIISFFLVISLLLMIFFICDVMACIF